VLPCAQRHRARHLAEGSGIVMCLMAPGPPPAQGGSGVATWLRHHDHHPAGLRYRHVSCGFRPAYWCRRAPEPPRAQWLSAPRRTRAFPRRLTSGPSWPHQARSAGSTLNMYVTGHTQLMAGIKCVQDIGTAGRQQNGADLPDVRNRQATMRRDLTP
jgi:hypothetical protein